MLRLFTLLTAVLLLAGCNNPAMLNTFSGSDDARRAGNLIYDPERNLRLDVYAPPGTRNAPVVVFLYGEAWKGGAKENYTWVAEALNSRGFVTVIPDYRKYPSVRFPAFVEDAARAVAWVQANIEPYGGSPQRLFVMGHDAGAHIASLLALDPRYLTAVRSSRSQLRGVIAMAGYYDFLPITDPMLRDLFGPVHKFGESQPLSYAGRGAPPLLLMHGENDAVVSVAQPRKLVDAIGSAGGLVETVYYPDMSHSRMLSALSRPLRNRYDVLDYIDRFVKTWMDRVQSEPSGIQTQPLSGGG